MKYKHKVIIIVALLVFALPQLNFGQLSTIWERTYELEEIGVHPNFSSLSKFTRYDLTDGSFLIIGRSNIGGNFPDTSHFVCNILRFHKNGDHVWTTEIKLDSYTIEIENVVLKGGSIYLLGRISLLGNNGSTYYPYLTKLSFDGEIIYDRILWDYEAVWPKSVVITESNETLVIANGRGQIPYFIRFNVDGDLLDIDRFYFYDENDEARRIELLYILPTSNSRFFILGILDNFYVCAYLIDNLGQTIWSKKTDVIDCMWILSAIKYDEESIIFVKDVGYLTAAGIHRINSEGVVSKVLDIVKDGRSSFGPLEGVIRLDNLFLDTDGAIVLTARNFDQYGIAKIAINDELHWFEYIDVEEQVIPVVVDSEGNYYGSESYYSDNLIIAKYEHKPVSVPEEAIEIPSAYYLSEAYPNPFNNVTRINYGLASAGKVSVRVYDLSGRLVSTLVDAVKSEGSHSVLWDASKFATGVYLVKMETANFSESRKIVLMK